MTEYSTSELKKALSISKNMWEKYKDDILEYMKSFFDYEIYSKGSKVCYLLKEQYQEWIPYKRKDIEKQKAYYTEKTDQIISIQPRNTGSNIARIIDKNNLNIYNHKEGTIGNYIRPILKSKYISCKENRVWCEFNDETLVYTPLSQEQLDYLYSYFKVNDKAVFDLIADYRAGTINEEEMGFEISMMHNCPYDYAVNKFIDKYGFRPIRVPLWENKII